MFSPEIYNIYSFLERIQSLCQNIELIPKLDKLDVIIYLI